MLPQEILFLRLLMRPFLMVESAVLPVVTHSAINQRKILLTTRTQDYAHVDKN